MRVSNLVLHLASSLLLSAFASPAPSPQGEDFVPIAGLTDGSSLVVPTMPEGTIFTIQTSTPQAYPTNSAIPEDDGDDEWCDSDDDDEMPVPEAPSPSPVGNLDASTIIDLGYPTSTDEPPLGLAPGIYQIHPVRALISMCLSIIDGLEPADGTPVVINTDLTVPAQWYPPAGNVYIKLAGTHYCLEASFPLSDGTPMKISSTLLQRFNYALDSSLYLVDQDQCLDLRDGNIVIGSVVQTWDCVSGNTNQYALLHFAKHHRHSTFLPPSWSAPSRHCRAFACSTGPIVASHSLSKDIFTSDSPAPSALEYD
ncbi:hypothetical protein NliqN6_3210 [Naganishia liquefaciens]|uniref:Ricin B lectin domain-containing protein n=1 Tax=Naganishia liquefaciens TaxID=104408 RepID=A0A8H3TTW8_9TREE|nr:hypothetical protein NliqN6_3210 [Naganishia liquefaciens]